MDFSQEFLERVLLLLLTSGIGGLLVPYVLKLIDERKQRERKQFESFIIRQSKVIEAQSQLLENIAEQLWEFRLLAVAVSYNKIHKNETKYQESFQTYNDKAWKYFGSIRTEISKASYLLSENTSQVLLSFYKEELIPRDSELVKLVEKDAPLEEWSKYHYRIQTLAGEKIDQVLDCIAEEIQLSRNALIG